MIIKLKLLNRTNIVGITLFPFIFVRGNVSKRTLNHEKIHIQQQLELLVIPFYLIYLWDYLVGLVKYRDKDLAYENIRFEKEAYNNSMNFNYLKTRKRYKYSNQYK